jgi:hypothetical protein
MRLLGRRGRAGRASKRQSRETAITSTILIIFQVQRRTSAPGVVPGSHPGPARDRARRTGRRHYRGIRCPGALGCGSRGWREQRAVGGVNLAIQLAAAVDRREVTGVTRRVS